MYNLNQNLHFIGIGGVGMAGIAEVLLNLGYGISGSDLKSNGLIEHLQELGAEITLGHSPENIPQKTSVAVISSAVDTENVEVQEAERRGIPIIPRAEMLAELMRMKYGIAIAGSHGKTTTTSMTAKLLQEMGLDPTVIIGGRVLSQHSGARLGMGQYLVAEADESDGSFCLLRPAIAVVTNIDAEHLSFYRSFGALEESFFSFMNQIPFYGLVVACGDDPVVRRLVSRLKRRTLLYGLTPENEITARNIQQRGKVQVYTLVIQGEERAQIELPMPGLHMVSNSLAAIAVGLELGAFPEEAATGLRSFPGVSRRAEIVGEEAGVLVIDDYGHHPTEIAATLPGLRRAWLQHQAEKYKQGELGRLIVVFQPHRYSRTRELFTEFLSCFSEADILYLTEIYPAGETAIPGISGEALSAAVQHKDVTFVTSPQASIPHLLEQLRTGDVVVTLGAGSIGKLGSEILDVLKSKRTLAC